MPLSGFPTEQPTSYKPGIVKLFDSAPSPRILREPTVNFSEGPLANGLIEVEGHCLRFSAKRSKTSRLVSSIINFPRRVADHEESGRWQLRNMGLRLKLLDNEITPPAKEEVIATYRGRVTYIENEEASVVMMDEASGANLEALIEKQQLEGIAVGEEFRMKIVSFGEYSKCTFEKIERRAVTKEEIDAAIESARSGKKV